MKRSLLIGVLALLSACGVGGLPPKGMSGAQALSGSAEWLEFEAPSVRQELFRDVATQSQLQAGHKGSVLFPMVRDGELVAAPAIDPKQDLLSALDGGSPVSLVFDTRGDLFGDDRREAFQGLSEREATELVARSLLQHWGVQPSGPVKVMRATGAPYAAAWVDGVLRINPAFVTMASSGVP